MLRIAGPVKTTKTITSACEISSFPVFAVNFPNVVEGFPENDPRKLSQYNAFVLLCFGVETRKNRF